MKLSALIVSIHIVSSAAIHAQTTEFLERFYRDQFNRARTSQITYTKTETIPPLILRGGLEGVQERGKWIAAQFTLIPEFRKSKNYDPEKESEVLKSILTFEKEMYEPLVYHREITYITTPKKRGKIIKQLSPGEPFDQIMVFDGEKSFLYLPREDELNTRHNRVWLDPRLGLCRYGADIGWWLSRGFKLEKENEYYTLNDSQGKIGISFLIDPSNQNAWITMNSNNGLHTIHASDFQIIDGLPVPKTVIVRQRMMDGTYYEIERLELLEAEINGPIDEGIFKMPKAKTLYSRFPNKEESNR